MQSDLRLDDCSHCACVTYLDGYTRESAIKDMESGALSCDNCLDTEPDDDDHHACVALYDGDEMILDRRHSDV